jgi:creatinine amidohydrolase
VELSWPEVKRASEAGALVLLPIGVIEEHGPHMGLGPDTYLAYRRYTLLRQRLESQAGATPERTPPDRQGSHSFPAAPA